MTFARVVRLAVLGTALCAAGARAQAPTGTIRGRVVDSANRQGVHRVSVVFGNRTAVTEADGRFAITDARAGSDTLRVRLIGFAPVTRMVTLAAGQTLDVGDLAIAAQAVDLSEIIVTGYGEQRAGDITGAVSVVADSEFNTGRIISPAMLIQNKVAGVQVVENNDPGGGMSLRIRGATSVTASSEPLYVIDGLPVGTGAGGGMSAGRDPLNFLNPDDIENITVLRDASASAIYGSNASNGVVIITTRGARAREGTRFEYSGNFAASQVTRTPNVMNGAEFTAAVTQYAPARVDSLLGQNTNWFDEISRTAYSQEHNLSVSNGGDNTSYRLAFGYLEQEGVIDASRVERFTLSMNLNQRLFADRMNVRANLRGSRAIDHFTPGDVLGNAASMAPTQPVLDPARPNGYWDWNTTNASPSNPVASVNLASDQGSTWRSMGNIMADYRLNFIEGLKANVNLGYDLTRAERNQFFPNDLAAQIRQGQGFWEQTNNSLVNSVFETYLDYQRTNMGPGSINVVGGYSYNSQHGEFPLTQARGLTSNLLGPNGVPPAANNTSTLFESDYKLISFFGRANYNIKDRYLLAASLRRDGSSRFGPGNQWGTFPSISGAWRISGENFMRRFGSISELKLRASWAVTGNQSFGDYLAYSTYTFSDNLSRVQFGDVLVNTIRPSAVDEGIHWEETDAVNFGLDFGFNNQRWTGAIDFYSRKTTDLIFFVPVAAGTTLGNFVTTNVGSMKNSGFELALNGRILNGGGGKLGYNASFTVGHNSNELTSINPTASVARILTGGISGGVGNMIQVLQPGVPVNSFYVYEHKRDASGLPIYATGTGADTAMYVDRNGDNVINEQDRRAYESPQPDWILGHSSYFSMGRFDASFTLRAYLGNYVYNNIASANGAYQNLSGSGMPSNLDRSVLETGFVTPQYYSDYFVEDASFLRMDNLTFGYSFNLQNRPVRAFLSVQNVLTITGYSGVDPTSGLNGIDNNIYPRSRTISSGLSIRL